MTEEDKSHLKVKHLNVMTASDYDSEDVKKAKEDAKRKAEAEKQTSGR